MLAKAGIYLDANAGAPLRPQVLEALLSFLNGKENGALTGALNPSSSHSQGRQSRRFLAVARQQVAQSLGAGVEPQQIIFTSSGTEANQMAIRSALESRLLAGQKPHWILSAVEHPSVLEMKAWLKARGGSYSLLPVDQNGRYDFSVLEQLWQPETALVSLLWVNNETGVINDCRLAAEQSAKKGALFHLDAAQAWGKLSLEVKALGAQFVTFSGPKIGALGGTGLLWLEAGTPVESLILGKQERQRRGGTENLLGAISLGSAAAQLNPIAWKSRVEPLRDRLEQAIRARIPSVRVNGGETPRVANTLNISFENIGKGGVIEALDLAGYSVSRGAACSSGIIQASHVLEAMGLSRRQAEASLRISLVDEIPWLEIEGFVDALETVLRTGKIKETKTTDNVEVKS